jgi:hypothetical protein
MGVQGMTGAKSNNRRSVAGDPLNDLLDDTPMKRSAARARPRITYAPSASGSNVWWIAAAASLVWGAAVLAFSWARFSLPGDPRSVVEAAQSRIEIADWLMILSAIAGPVLLIWVIAWLVRRSMELRDESRRLAKAAILLADAAESAEKRAELMLPAPDSMGGGELISDGSGHLHREIERASHAMSALQTQMSSMETALAKQSAAFDNAAERARKQTQALSVGALGAGAGAVAAVSAGKAALSPSESGNSPKGQELTTPEPRTPAPTAPAAAAVDMTLAPETSVDRARQDLLAAKQSSGWNKLVPDGSQPEPRQTSASKTSLEEMREDVAAIQTPRDDAAPSLKTPPPPASAAVDPFDDLGPSTPKAAVGAALGAGVAMGFGATRDESEPREAAVTLGAPLTAEPDPAPTLQPSPPVPDSVGAKDEEFEFMPRALDWKKFVKAANFPENERDTATLDALYEVLTDPEAAALLQSSEDTLATLADLDLYMEDFVPEMSPVTTWRAHLEGRAGVQGLDAPIEQSRINAKLNADAAFSKLSERFVERYQVMLKRLFREGADERLAIELADSRTGRAYILVADALGKL